SDLKSQRGRNGTHLGAGDAGKLHQSALLDEIRVIIRGAHIDAVIEENARPVVTKAHTELDAIEVHVAAHPGNRHAFAENANRGVELESFAIQVASQQQLRVVTGQLQSGVVITFGVVDTAPHRNVFVESRSTHQGAAAELQVTYAGGFDIDPVQRPADRKHLVIRGCLNPATANGENACQAKNSCPLDHESLLVRFIPASAGRAYIVLYGHQGNDAPQISRTE